MKKINLSDVALKSEDKAKRLENQSEQTSSTMATSVSTTPIGSTSTSKKKLKTSFKTKVRNLSRPRKIFLLVLLGGIMLLLPLLYIGSVVMAEPYTPPYLIDKDSDFIESEKSPIEMLFTAFLLPKPSEPKTEPNPLTGVLYTKTEMREMMKNAPVAAMVNNHSAARPQSGLDSADIVFETEVESGITRYMPIFWSKGVEKVGPIRSARYYYLEMMSPYNPIYIHDGQATSDDPKVDVPSAIYKFGIKDIATSGAWRVNDGIRFSPHNEYSSVFNAWKVTESKGWNEFPNDLDSWKFKKDSPSKDSKLEVKASFNQRLANGGAYDTRWKYDPITNKYIRFIAGEVDIDQETGSQLAFKNVIFQFTDIISTYDDKGHIIVETIGSGDAKILIDGKAINATWEKDSRTDITRYYDSNNKEIEFNRGTFWICLLDKSKGEFDIIK